MWHGWIETAALIDTLERCEENDGGWADVWDAIELLPEKKYEDLWWVPQKIRKPEPGERVAIKARDDIGEFLTVGWWTGFRWMLPEGNYEVIAWKEIQI